MDFGLVWHTDSKYGIIATLLKKPILAGNYPGIHVRTSQAKCTGISSECASDVLPELVTGILPWVSSGILSGILT